MHALVVALIVVGIVVLVLLLAFGLIALVWSLRSERIESVSTTLAFDLQDRCLKPLLERDPDLTDRLFWNYALRKEFARTLSVVVSAPPAPSPQGSPGGHEANDITPPARPHRRGPVVREPRLQQIAQIVFTHLGAFALGVSVMFFAFLIEGYIKPSEGRITPYELAAEELDGAIEHLDGAGYRITLTDRRSPPRFNPVGFYVDFGPGKPPPSSRLRGGDPCSGFTSSTDAFPFLEVCMSTPFHHRPYKAGKTFEVELDYEGDNAHLVGMAMGKALEQALLAMTQQAEDQARLMEIEARQMEQSMLGQLTGRTPDALTHQQVNQRVPSSNGRVPSRG